MTRLDKLEFLMTVLMIVGWLIYFVARFTSHPDVQILPGTN